MDDLDKPRETTEQRAKRQWGNHDLTKRFLESKRPAPAPIKTEPDIAEVITTERLKPDVVTKFERQFIKDLREMLEGHTRRNMLLYKLSLKMRIHRLRKEKLKRLMAQQATIQKKDLFT